MDTKRGLGGYSEAYLLYEGLEMRHPNSKTTNTNFVLAGTTKFPNREDLPGMAFVLPQTFPKHTISQRPAYGGQSRSRQRRHRACACKLSQFWQMHGCGCSAVT